MSLFDGAGLFYLLLVGVNVINGSTDEEYRALGLAILLSELLNGTLRRFASACELV